MYLFNSFVILVPYVYIVACSCDCEQRILELERKVELLLNEKSVSGGTSTTYNSHANFSSIHIRNSKRAVGEGQAFHAYLSGNRCFGSRETFVFDREEIDIGDGYNTLDGIYDVPETGVYVFTVTVIPDFFKYVQAEIVVNGVVKGRVFADSQEIHDRHPASTTIVVRANVGDHVFVRRGTQGKCDVVSGDYPAWTTFSGWMLF